MNEEKTGLLLSKVMNGEAKPTRYYAWVNKNLCALNTEFERIRCINKMEKDTVELKNGDYLLDLYVKDDLINTIKISNDYYQYLIEHFFSGVKTIGQ